MWHISEIGQHMEVVGSCGGHVGFVDGVEDNAIRLTPDGTDADAHPYVPLAWVEAVGQTVRLRKPAAEARHEWLAHPAGFTR